MTQSDGATRQREPSIAVQLILLLMAGWVLTLGVTATIMAVLPPPPSAAYRLSELADALKDGPLSRREGRDLLRSAEAQPPVTGRPRVTNGIYRLALAGALHVPISRVRLERYPSADPVRRFLLRALAAPARSPSSPGFFYGPPLPPDDASAPGSSRPPDFTRNLPTPSAASEDAGWPVASSPRRGGAAVPPQAPPPPLDRLPPLSGRFALALQGASGQWTVLRPTPEVFPNPWQQRVMLWFVACLGVLAPVGYAFARHYTAPIVLFARAAERLGRDPSAAPMELSGPAEIGRAAAAFNEMQSRLQRYVEHRTAMVGAIAHDLRTPLARMRFKIEDLPKQTKLALSHDIQQMEQMISAALAFVRDAGETRPRTLVDLSSVVQCVCDSAVLMRTDVRITEAMSLAVRADSLALERMLGNLVDNAVKYGGCARIALRREDSMAVVEVSDNGPGLPESERERVFEPFYRVEPSRNPETGGIGLGLAVARSVARAHGGDIELQNGRRGMIARVRLPLPPEVLCQITAPSPITPRTPVDA